MTALWSKLSQGLSNGSSLYCGEKNPLKISMLNNQLIPQSVTMCFILHICMASTQHQVWKKKRPPGQAHITDAEEMQKKYQIIDALFFFFFSPLRYICESKRSSRTTREGSWIGCIHHVPHRKVDRDAQAKGRYHNTLCKFCSLWCAELLWLTFRQAADRGWKCLPCSVPSQALGCLSRKTFVSCRLCSCLPALQQQTSRPRQNEHLNYF